MKDLLLKRRKIYNISLLEESKNRQKVRDLLRNLQLLLKTCNRVKIQCRPGNLVHWEWLLNAILTGAGGRQPYNKTIVLFSALPLVNWKALYIVHQTKLCILFKTNKLQSCMQFFVFEHSQTPRIIK